MFAQDRPAVWSERRDLNPGPPVPQTGALTGLRYAPPSAKLYAAALAGASAAFARMARA